MNNEILLTEAKSKKFNTDAENLFNKIKRVVSRSGLDKDFEIKEEHDDSGNVLKIMGYDYAGSNDNYEFVINIEFVYSGRLRTKLDKAASFFGKGTERTTQDDEGEFLNSFKISGEIQDIPFKNFSIKKENPKETLIELLNVVVAVVRKARTYGEKAPDVENRSPKSIEKQEYGQHKAATRNSAQDYFEKALGAPNIEDAMKNFIIGYKKYHGKS